MQVSLHVQQTLTQVSLRIKQSIRLHSNCPPAPQFLSTTLFPIDIFPLRFMTKIFNEFTKRTIAIRLGSMEPIIIAFGRLGEIES